MAAAAEDEEGVQGSGGGGEAARKWGWAGKWDLWYKSRPHAWLGQHWPYAVTPASADTDSPRLLPELKSDAVLVIGDSMRALQEEAFSVRQIVICPFWVGVAGIAIRHNTDGRLPPVFGIAIYACCRQRNEQQGRTDRGVPDSPRCARHRVVWQQLTDFD